MGIGLRKLTGPRSLAGLLAACAIMAPRSAATQISWDAPPTLRGGEPSVARELRYPRAESGLVPFLRNAGFEDLTSQGTPAFWNAFREGFVDTDPSLAHSGQRSIRGSAAFTWSQDIAVPGSPYECFAINGFGSQDLGFESARVRASFFGADGAYVGDRTGDSPVTTGSLYGSFWSVLSIPPGAQTATVYPGGRGAAEWLRMDDLRIYLDHFTPDPAVIGEPWTLAGSAWVNGGGIVLKQPGDSMSQRVASGIDGQRYFVHGLLSTGVPCEIAVVDERLPRDETESTVTVSGTAKISPDAHSFLVDLPSVPPTRSGVSRVRIGLASGGPIALIGLSRGFAEVQPDILTIGDGSQDKGLVVTASWPRKLTDARMTIVTASGSEVTTLAVTRTGSSARATWDGGNVPAGDYAALIRLTGQAGEVVELVRPFRIEREDTVPEVKPLRSRQFARVAWLYTRFDKSPDDTAKAIGLAARDGFDQAIIHCRLDQLPTVRGACERSRLPFVIQLDEVRAVFAEYAFQDYFSEADYLARVDELVQPVSSSRQYRGVYVVDEPVTPEQYDLNRRVNLCLARRGQPGPAFAVLPDTVTTPVITSVNPAAVMVDIYPFRNSSVADNTAVLLDRIGQMNDYARAARGQGRDFWLVPEAFEAVEFDIFRTVPLSMHRAQLGAAVLAGARGVVPFTYTSISYIEGLRGPDLEPTPKLAAYTEFNRVAGQLSSVLMQMDVPVIDKRAPRPFALSMARHPRHGNVAIVLNADDLQPRTLIVTLSEKPRGAIRDLVAGRRCPTSGPYLKLALPPGAWTMVTLGNLRVNGLEAEPAPPPGLSNLTFPVTHEFTARTLGGAPLLLGAVDLNEAADMAAVSAYRFQYEPSQLRFYRLEPGGSVTQPQTPLYWGGERAFFRGALAASASVNLGARFFDANQLDAQPVSEFLGATGGAYDALRSGDTVWLTAGGYGIRQLAVAPGGLELVGSGSSDSDLYLNLFGPFEGGNASFIVRNNGVDTVEPGRLAEDEHSRAALNRVQAGGSLSTSGVLAVPRYQRGVGLFQLDAEGSATVVGRDHRGAGGGGRGGLGPAGCARRVRQRLQCEVPADHARLPRAAVGGVAPARPRPRLLLLGCREERTPRDRSGRRAGDCRRHPHRPFLSPDARLREFPSLWHAARQGGAFMRIVALLPTYNEAENIAPLIGEILALGPEYEVLVVDDDSPDGTWRIVGDTAARDPRVHLMHRTSERGRGSAGIAGFQWARDNGADAVIEMDADFSHHPRFIPMLAEPVRAGTADIVIGSRLVEGGAEQGRHAARKAITLGANAYIRLVLGLPIRDCTSGFRAFSRRALDAIPWEKMTARGPEIVQEVLHQARRNGPQVRREADPLRGAPRRAVHLQRKDHGPQLRLCAEATARAAVT